MTNEVGCGIVPENALAREFRDRAGIMNQRFAEAADEVYWMVFGQPLTREVMSQALGFRAAIRFLTIVPVRGGDAPPGRAAAFFPLVGAMLGAAGAGVYSSGGDGVSGFDRRAGDGRVLDRDLGRPA